MSDTRLEVILAARDLTGGAFEKVQREIKSLSSGVSAFSMAAGVGSAAIVAGFTAAAAVITTKFIPAASNLQEIQSKFDVVFAGQTTLVNKWAENLVDKYAMSTREAKQYQSSIQDLLVPMGMQEKAAARLSNEIVKLSADLGSFNNMPTAQVMESVQSALVGNYETMKKFGVVINETRVQQEALNMGLVKTKDELTGADKAQAAYSLMVKSSTAAMGDMERTADGYANTTKRLSSEWEDFSAALGEKFLPAATSVKGVLADIFDSITKTLKPDGLPEYIDKLQKLKVLVDSKPKIFSEIAHEVNVGKNKEKISAIEKKIGELNFALKEARIFENGIMTGKESNYTPPVVMPSEKEISDLKKQTEERARALGIISEEYKTLTISTKGYADAEKRLQDLKIDKWYADQLKVLKQTTPELEKTVELMRLRNQQEYDFQNRYENRDLGMTWDDSDLTPENILKNQADWQKKYDEYRIKRFEDTTQRLKKINEDYLKKQKEDYEDFADTIQETTYDVLKAEGNRWKSLTGIVKNTMYQIEAELISKKFVVPVFLQAGSALGMSWNGTSFSSMANGGGTNPLNMISGANSVYNAFNGGVSNFLGPGGIGGKVGSSVFGNSAWYGAGATTPLLGGLPYYGASEFMVPAAAGAAGSTGIASVLGAVAPYAAIAAIAIPLLVNAFKKEKDPVMAFHFGAADASRPGSTVSDMGFYTYSQKMSAETDATVKKYFEAQFKAIDTSLSINFEDVLKKRAASADAGADLVGTGWNPETYGGVEATLKAASSWIAKNLAQGVAEAYGITGLTNGVNGTAASFFESILPEGSENLLDSFTRFGAVMDSTEDSAAAIARQLGIMNGNMTDAFLNLESISGVFKSMDALIDPILEIQDPLVQTVDKFNTWIDSLDDAKATLEQITDAEEKRNLAISAQITGLNATSVANALQQAIMGIGDIAANISAIMKQSVSTALAGSMTNGLVEKYITPFNQQIGMVFDAVGGDINRLFAVLPDIIDSVDINGIMSDVDQLTAKWDRFFNTAAVDIESLTASRDSAAKEYLGALEEELAVLENNLNSAKSRYLDLLDDELAAQKDMVSALTPAIRDLKEFRTEIWSNGVGGSGKGIFAGQISEFAKSAMAGNTTAISDLIASSGKYLTAAKGSTTSWIDYARDMAKTSVVLSGVESAAADQLSEAERQSDYLQGLLDEVNGVQNQVTDIATARADYEAAKIAFDESWMQDEVATLKALLGSSQTLEQLMADFIAAQNALKNAGTGGGSSRTVTDYAQAEADYLAANPDVAKAVALGEFASGKQHYEMHGQYENRGLAGYAGLTSEGRYLNLYPDVAKAVQAGQFSSGLQHWAMYGVNEGRGFASGGSFTVNGNTGLDNLALPGLRVSAGEMVNITRPDVLAGMIKTSEMMIDELKALRTELQTANFQGIKNSQDILRLLKRFNGVDAMKVRVIA